MQWLENGPVIHPAGGFKPVWFTEITISWLKIGSKAEVHFFFFDIDAKWCERSTGCWKKHAVNEFIMFIKRFIQELCIDSPRNVKGHTTTSSMTSTLHSISTYIPLIPIIYIYIIPIIFSGFKTIISSNQTCWYPVDSSGSTGQNMSLVYARWWWVARRPRPAVNVVFVDDRFWECLRSGHQPWQSVYSLKHRDWSMMESEIDRKWAFSWEHVRSKSGSFQFRASQVWIFRGYLVPAQAEGTTAESPYLRWW